MTTLETGVLAAAGWAIGGFAASATRAWRRPASPVLAAPAGSAWRGLLHVFGPGMSPRAKESVRTHPLTYASGVTYHTGIVLALATLATTWSRVPISKPAGSAIATVLCAAAVAGAVLLARRSTSRLLRQISAADDYLSNAIVDAWLLAAAAACLFPDSRPAFLIASIVLGVYAPLGKIRHCVFFFLSRGLFGARLGRRGLVGARHAEVRP